MGERRFSETLLIIDGSIACGHCRQPLSAMDESWKSGARLSAVPAASLPGAGSATHPDVELRSFSCGACGTLLDSELALPGDPFLVDRLLPTRL
ncbi:hypothetical protein [Rhizorhabdus wittichii]|nr:hypothetical protein [Rhizorhabdus wittichii]